MWVGFMSVLLSAVGTARAGFHADLADLSARGASFGAACGSTRRVMDGLAALAVASGEGLPPEWASFRTLLSAEPGAGAFEGDGAFALGTAPAGGVELLLHTTLPASAVADRLARVSGAAVAPSGAGFRVRRAGATDAEEGLYVEALGADVRIGSAPASGTAPGPTVTSVLEPLPDLGPGCAVVGLVEDLPTGPAQFALYLPLDGAESGRFVVRSTAVAPPTAVLPGDAPRTVAPEVHTERVPAAWMSLGFGLVDLNLAAVLEGRELAQARRLQRYLPVAAGTTVGAFFEPTPAFGAVVPIDAPWPAQRVLRHARRVLRTLDAPTTRLERDVVQLELGTQPLVLSARPGALLVASDVATLLELRDGQGAPWMDAPTRERTADYLLALQLSELPGVFGLPPLTRPLWAALRVDGDRVVGDAVLPLGPDGWKAVLKVLKERGAPATDSVPITPLPPGADGA